MAFLFFLVLCYVLHIRTWPTCKVLIYVIYISFITNHQFLYIYIFLATWISFSAIVWADYLVSFQVIYSNPLITRNLHLFEQLFPT